MCLRGFNRSKRRKHQCPCGIGYVDLHECMNVMCCACLAMPDLCRPLRAPYIRTHIQSTTSGRTEPRMHPGSPITSWDTSAGMPLWRGQLCSMMMKPLAGGRRVTTNRMLQAPRHRLRGTGNGAEDSSDVDKGRCAACCRGRLVAAHTPREDLQGAVARNGSQVHRCALDDKGSRTARPNLHQLATCVFPIRPFVTLL